MAALPLILFVLSCSGLKLDAEKNCLNEKAACFKADVTRPRLQAAVFPTQNQLVSVINYVDLMFSEELNNPLPSDFVFSGPGQQLRVSSVQQLNGYTYRLSVVQTTLVSGNIYLDFPNLKDYNGNKITGPTTVTYIGNIDIPLTVPNIDPGNNPITNPTHTGLSATAYTTLDITWYYSYTPPAGNNTVYSVRRTTGSTDCKDPSAVDISGLITGASPAPGTVTPYDGTDITTRTNTTHKFTLTAASGALPYSGTPVAYTILICVDNDTYNKHGKVAINLVRANGPPVTTVSPIPGPYATPRQLTFSCTPFMDKIAYDLGTTTDNATDPAGTTNPPGFNASTGAITSGMLYDSNNKPTVAYSVDPTWSAYKIRCIDVAGNIEATNTKTIYKVDSTFPEVSFTSLYKSGTTTSVSGVSNTGYYQNVDLTFRTNQINRAWEIRSDGAACGSGGSTILSGVAGVGTGTPATANAPFTKTFAYNSGTMSASGVYTISLCVQSTLGQWGQDTFTLIRDDSVPTITMNVNGGSFGSLQNIVPTCSTNGDKIAYTTASIPGGSAPTAPSAPTFDTNGVMTSGTSFTTPLSTPDGFATTYVFVCLNKGGKITAAPVTHTYIIDSVLPTISILSNSRDYLSNVAGYTSTTLTWQSSRGGLTYYIKQPGTACNGATLNQPGLQTGTTPSDTSQTITNTFNIANFGADGAYALQVCVANNVGQWGYTDKTITVDTVLPTIPTPTLSITQVDATNFTLTIPAASDNNSVAGFYVYRTDTVSYPTYPGTPTYTVAMSPATLTMPTAQTYYLKVVPFDVAGNVPAAGASYAEVMTKPSVTLFVTGLDTANSKTFNLTDGVSSATITTNSPGGTPWATALGLGGTYSFSISTQPVGQVCAVKELQFGVLSANKTISVNCLDGFMVGGRFQALADAPLTYRLYQGKTTTMASGVFNNPENLAYLGGYLYIADPSNHVIKKVLATSPYTVTTLTSATVASNNATDDNASCASARFANMSAVFADGTNLYVAEWANGRIRKISDVAGSCSVTTLAGTGTGGFADGPGSTAQFSTPYQIVSDGTYLYVVDNGNYRIRRIKLDTGFVDTIAGSGGSGAADNATGTLATFDGTVGLALSGTDLYVGEYNNATIRKISLSTAGFPVTTVVGSAATQGQVDAKGLNARLGRAISLTAMGSNIYFVDFLYNTVRRIDIQNGYNVTTIAGNGSASSVDGTGASATFNNPHGITTDGRALYVTEYTANRLRKITDNGLVGYWPLNGNLADYSSDGNFAKNTTLSGNVSAASGRRSESNGAYYFDGTSDYLTAPGGSQADTNFNTGNFTIAFWMKPAATQVEMDAAPRDYDIVSNWLSQYDFAIRYHNEIPTGATIPVNTPGQINFIRFDGTTSNYCISGIRVDDGRFHHVTAQKSGTLLSLFIDGKKVCSITQSVGAITGVGPVVIGARPGSTINDFTGTLADMRMYSRALNDGEINELAQDALSTNVGNSFNTAATGLLSRYALTGASAADTGALNYLLTTVNGINVAGVDGDISGARLFNGSSEYLSTGSSPGLPLLRAPRTICAWVNPSAYPGAAMLASYGNSSNDQAFGLIMYGSTQIGLSAWNNDVLANTTIPLNTWTHICGAFDGSTATIYRNGVAISTGSFPSSLTTVAGNIVIGKNTGGSGAGYFNGKIDDVRIYNNALGATEIQQLATQIPAGILARYDFSGGTNDTSGWGNNLTSSGTAPGPTADRFQAANSAYNFSGAGKFQTAAALTAKADDISLTAWFRPTAFGSGIHYIIINGNGGDGYGVFIDGNAGNVIKGILGGLGYMNTTYVPPLNVWTHITMQRTSGTWAIFVNGVSLPLTTTGITLTTNPNVSTSPTFIGGDGGSVDNLTGDIDDARVYNRALSPAEVRALAGYHPMQAAGGNLIMHMNAESLSNLTAGTQISQWNDTTSSGIVMSQATPAFQPLYSATAINGRPGVDFNSRYFSFNCKTGLNSTANTIMGAFNQPSASGSFQTVMEHGNKLVYFNGPTNQFNLYHTGSGPTDFNVVASQNSYLTLGGANANMIFAIEHNGSSGSVYKNGIDRTSSSAIMGANTYSCGSTPTMGQVSWGPNYFNGHIGDLIYFDQALTSTSVYGTNTDREVVDCYLSAKYGLAVGHSCP